MKYSVNINGIPCVQKVVRNGYVYRETNRSIVAFHGACRVEAPRDEFFGGDESEPYVGEIIESPTWGQLFTEAQRQQQKTRDRHHDFFEGARVVRLDGGVKVIELFVGS